MIYSANRNPFFQFSFQALVKKALPIEACAIKAMASIALEIKGFAPVLVRIGLLGFFLLPAKISAKENIAVLGIYFEGRDSAFVEGLNRDVGQDLAEDSSFLVYDLRKKHGKYLDSLHELGQLQQLEVLNRVGGGLVHWGMVAECSELKDEIRCLWNTVDMTTGKNRMRSADAKNASLTGIDTTHMLLAAGEKRKQLSLALTNPFIAQFLAEKKANPAGGQLKLLPAANPAWLVRGLQIIKRGEISEIPIGCTLLTGDLPRLIRIKISPLNYVIYPHSSYTYLLPKVILVNSGALGVLKGLDSGSIEGRLQSVTALDKNNLIWRSLAKVAALDSNNLLWKGLGRVTSLDSHNIILNNLSKVARMDTNNILFKSLGNVTALDSTNLLLKTLTQVAAMDSSNLVWKGIGKVSELDSNNLIWKQLNQIASMDSNSIWSKLGILAFQDNTVVLTPSYISRGQPQAVIYRHEGNLSTLELVKGSISLQPLLSSQDPIQVGTLHTVRTRGYATKQERMDPSRGDYILRELESANSKEKTLSLLTLLPGKFFSEGSALRTPDRPVQAFISMEFKELDMEVDALSSEKEGWTEFNNTLHTGGQESGCFLCSPNRLGP